MSDIYAVTVTLQKDEAYGKVVKLQRGHYKFSVTRHNGDPDQIRLEAELRVLGVPHLIYSQVCPTPTVDVEFNVKNDNDAWEVTISNTSSTNKVKITAKLTKE